MRQPEYAVCSFFGCGRRLTLQEQLFGNTCIIHNTKDKIIGMVHKTMTKEQAIEAMKDGKVVRHTLFLKYESISMTTRGNIIFEDGTNVPADLFWKDRTADIWNTNWSIV